MTYTLIWPLKKAKSSSNGLEKGAVGWSKNTRNRQKEKKIRNAFSGETKFMEVNKGDELDLSSLQNKQKEIRGKKRLKMEWGRFY